jgi:hypothetical protein
MKKVIRLTESDLTRIVKRVIKEQAQPNLQDCLKGVGTVPQSCKETDAGACIKDLGRMIYTSGPDAAVPLADAIKCLRTKMGPQKY